VHAVHPRIGLALLAVTCAVRANAGHELASAQSANGNAGITAELPALDHATRARLEKQLDEHMPVVLTLCAAACSARLHGLALDLEYLARDPQLRFHALSVNIDPHDTAQDATFVLDAHGRVVRRLAGISVEPRDLWQALLDASALTVSSRGSR